MNFFLDQFIQRTKVYRQFQKTQLFRALKEIQINLLYISQDYLKAYSQHTDMRIKFDPQLGIGGSWEEIGKLQFNFLVSQEMQPNNTLLDIGCGTLRGGRHFIKFLNPDNYTGIDISPEAINYGKKLVEEEGLSHKNPKLIINKNLSLKFDEFSNETFDYLLAQSVFTHLQPPQIEECFKNIKKVMNKSSRFFFTFGEAEEYRKFNQKDFNYPFSFFEKLAKQYKFDIKRVDYAHPRKQKMVLLKKH